MILWAGWLSDSHCVANQPSFSTSLGESSGTDGNIYGQKKNVALTEAEDLLKAGKGKNAWAIYEAYLRIHPNSSEALLGLGLIAQHRLDYPMARRYLERALAVNPYDANLLAELARLYHQWSTNPFMETENYQARVDEYFHQALGLAPENLLTLAYQGEYFLDCDQWVQAEQQFQKVLRLDPRFVPAYQGLTRYYLRVKDLSQAKDTILQAIELEPANQRSYFIMAELLAVAEHPEKAVHYALRSEQLDFGQDPERDYFLAQQLEKLGNTVQAIIYYDRVVRNAPSHTPSLTKLAQLHEQQGNQEESLRFYEKAMNQDPGILRQMADQAATALRLEKTGESFPQWIRLLRLTHGKDHPDYQRIHSQALHGIASGAYLESYYNRLERERATTLEAAFEQYGQELTDPIFKMDRLKMILAKHQVMSEDVRRQLLTVSQGSDDLAAGEALFLLQDYPAAQDRLDNVDGQTAEGYLDIGDRLLLDQALLSATAMYQRGYQIAPLPAIKQGLERLNAKKTLAEQRITEGNEAFLLKQYNDARRLYDEAKKIFPGWDIPYIRLGETYEKMKGYPLDVYYAYRQAVQINPALLNSEGFAKRYQKLEKKAQKFQKKQ